jgi:hypothetical protein
VEERVEMECQIALGAEKKNMVAELPMAMLKWAEDKRLDSGEC